MKKLTSLMVAWLVTAASLSYGQTYTIGVEDIDYYPLYAYRNGSYQGFAQEVLTKFADSKGYTFQFKPFPVVRLINYFVEGKVDFKFPDNENWAGDAKKGINEVYSDAVVPYTDGVMVLPANKGKGTAALKKLGTVRGFTPWDYLSLIKSGAVVAKEASSLESLIQQTIHGRVDGAYFNTIVASYYLANVKKQAGALVFDDTLPHTSSTYKLSSHKHPKVIEEFNQFLVDESPWVRQLEKKYGIE